MRTVVFWVYDELACILNLKLIITTLALELLWDLKNTWNFMKALVVFRQLLLKLKASIWQDEIRVHMYIEMYALRSNFPLVKGVITEGQRWPFLRGEKGAWNWRRAKNRGGEGIMNNELVGCGDERHQTIAGFLLSPKKHLGRKKLGTKFGWAILKAVGVPSSCRSKVNKFGQQRQSG